MTGNQFIANEDLIRFTTRKGLSRSTMRRIVRDAYPAAISIQSVDGGYIAFFTYDAIKLWRGQK